MSPTEGKSSLGRKLKHSLLTAVHNNVSPKVRDNLYLKAFGLFKVPVLGFIGPKVVDATDERCVISIPLNRKTKNHLNSMYFGVLSAGADCAGGLMAMRLIQGKGARVALIFKDFHADFLKRDQGETHKTS